MIRGSILDLERAASLVAKCQAEDTQLQAELEAIERRLQALIYQLNGAAVRKVAGV